MCYPRSQRHCTQSSQCPHSHILVKVFLHQSQSDKPKRCNGSLKRKDVSTKPFETWESKGTWHHQKNTITFRYLTPKKWRSENHPKRKFNIIILRKVSKIQENTERHQWSQENNAWKKKREKFNKEIEILKRTKQIFWSWRTDEWNKNCNREPQQSNRRQNLWACQIS